MAASKTTKKTKTPARKAPKLAKNRRAELEQALQAGFEAEMERARKRVQEQLGTSERMWERIRRAEADSLRARLRLQYQPWLVAGAVAALALIGQAAALAVGPTACAAGTGALIGAVTVLLRRTREGRWSEAGAWMREHPARMVVAAAAAWVWVVASLLLGFAHADVLAAAGMVGFVGLASHWWRRHRIGHEPQTGTGSAAPAVAPAEIGEHYAALWQQHLAEKPGDFSGTALAAHRPTEYGHAWDLRMKPGSRGLDALATQLDVVATALGVAKKYISLGEHESDPDNPLLGTLRVTTDSPTKGPVAVEEGADGVPRILGRPVWDPATGDITVGPYADGVGMHTWGLYRPNSLFGGYLFGAQGSGKSELLNLLVLGMRLSGHTAVWYLDGQGGTQPTLMGAADWDASASAETRRLALEAAAITIKIRGLTNKEAGAAGFTPTPARPGLVLIIDESHEVINDYVRVPPPTRKELEDGAAPDPGFGSWTNVELVDMITRIGRKCGVAVVAASQDTGLAAFGGQSLGRVIRGNLFTGNAGLMRSEDAVGAQIAPKAALSPTELPPGGGYGAAANETGSDGGISTRRAMWRAGFTGRFAELIERAGPSPVLEEAAAYYIDSLLEGAYAKRHEVSAEDRAAAAGDAVRAGMEGLLSPTAVLFGSPEAVRAARPAGGAAEDPMGFPDLGDFITEVEDHLAEAAAAGAERVPPVLAAARAAFEAGADTRMHTEALAAALSMPAAQMQERLRAAGVRPLRRAFTRRGKEARGYALADVDAAIAAHAETETA